MAPKFKGNSEDWLDDEDSVNKTTRGPRPKSSKKGSKKDPSAAQPNAQVVEVFPNQCRARLDEDQKEILCTYRRTLLLAKNSPMRERSPVAVGDRVEVVQIDESSAVIENIAPRTNQLTRPSPERDSRHVIVANVELLIVVAASQDPAFSPGLVDRFLVAAGLQNIPTILCINKIDLYTQTGEHRPWKVYQDIGIPVVELSAKQNLGTEELKKLIASQTAVFCGHSGVGKTSLLNRLLGKEKGRVGDISQATGKGQHTTTGAVLIEGTQWIDTPGVRAFGLVDLQPEELKDYFVELASLHCAVDDCNHMDQAGCQATTLPRYQSYRRIYESLKAGEN